MNLYLETGQKKIGVHAIAWPGLSRTIKIKDGGEPAAVQTILDYAPRYQRIMDKADMRFEVPTAQDALQVVSRYEGDAGTDFGGPSVTAAEDDASVSAADLEHFKALLAACYAGLAAAAVAAEGKQLRKGPRGGGRDLDKIIDHVLEAELSYLRRIAWPLKRNIKDESPAEKWDRVQAGVLDGLTNAVENGLPAAGPRGGKIWTVRAYVRRSAWHLTDHIWEIEDRAENNR